MKKLTKTHFVDFLKCPHSFYLKHNNPEYKPQISESDLFTIEEGLHFEKVVQTFFQSQEYKSHVVFETDKYYAEADIVKFISDKEIEIFEVKASTKIKNAFIWDISFQRQVAEECGYKVSHVHLIYANKDYVYDGKTITPELFLNYDIEREVVEYQEEMTSSIEDAFQYLNGISTPEPILHDCNDKHKCDYTTLINPLPEYHVGLIPRIRKDKFFQLWHGSVHKIKDVPEDYPLTDIQKNLVQLVKNKAITIHRSALRKWYKTLEYPLYFLDYETYAPSVPTNADHKPFERMVFQYSLHKLESPESDTKHFEYILTNDEKDAEGLIKHLIEDILDKGSILVWNDSFEKGCNKILADKHPQYSDLLQSINNRIVDQMKIFKDHVYYDYKFKGSYSIKNVLPVLVPKLSYDGLNIHRGDIASYRWKKAVIEKHEKYPEPETIQDLLGYCKLDTLAMVRIHQRLLDETRNSLRAI